jgi:hypothetical protein
LAEKTTGAEIALLAASADADLRKSRRFIENSPDQPRWSDETVFKPRARWAWRAVAAAKPLLHLLESRKLAGCAQAGRAACTWPIAYNAPVLG